jgi:ubiquinone/menaquinone biosynthesis C-methylase UbiE
MEGQPTTNQQSFFWNLYGRCYDGINHAIPYRGLLYDVYVSLDLKPGQKILDAGCGTGNFERFISERDIPDVQIKAIDFSSAMMARAKQKCKDLDFVKFTAADLNERLNYPDNSFDRILCCNVLYSLKDPVSSIAEFLRVLKPEGKLVIANPKPGFKVIAIVTDHFKRIGNIWGLGRKLLTFVKTLVLLPTMGLAPILLNLFVIEKKGEQREYHFLSEKNLRHLLEQNQLTDITIMNAYSDQDLFTVATKAA